VNVTVTLEQRFASAPDGTVWTPSQGSYQYFQRYLEVFDQVRVVARIERVAQINSDWKRADGDGVRFEPIPYYVGPWQYLRHAREIKRRLHKVALSSEAAILHAPSILTTSLVDAFAGRRQLYALEVMGSPWDVFAPGAIRHPLRPYLRVRFSRELERQCMGACATAYVTRQALQTRYPPNPSEFSTHYSNVELSENSFSAMPRTGNCTGPVTLLLVGSLAQMYKGPDVLIEAADICLKQGLDVRVLIIGEGQYRASLEARVSRLGLASRIRFGGHVKDLQAELDRADVFVLPSRTEGLPRAMIEAMARGLPCIGTTVGGIPELLSADDLVPPGDAMALAEKLRSVIQQPGRLAAMSKRNLVHAKDYHESRLARARRTFYEYVKVRTAEWLHAQKPMVHARTVESIPSHLRNAGSH